MYGRLRRTFLLSAYGSSDLRRKKSTENSSLTHAWKKITTEGENKETTPSTELLRQSPHENATVCRQDNMGPCANTLPCR